MNDYDRVAAAIRFLDEHHTKQPCLSDLAGAAGLSESHFHRLFKRWAGVTPKDFLQCLTNEHAKRLLRKSLSVLDVALDSGLSGPGRLHDLLVTLEAASPGEFKTGGAGVVIQWGLAASPFGTCAIGWNTRGICHLSFLDSVPARGEPLELREQWPAATFTRTDEEANHLAKQLFVHPPAKALPLKAFVRATPFQLQVWRALLRIPEGSVSSYGALARLIGHSACGRAIGGACGSNPIAYVIPCHRVIRETGAVSGYRWGDVRKRAMLAWESTRSLARSQLEPQSPAGLGP